MRGFLLLCFSVARLPSESRICWDSKGPPPSCLFGTNSPNLPYDKLPLCICYVRAPSVEQKAGFWFRSTKQVGFLLFFKRKRKKERGDWSNGFTYLAKNVTRSRGELTACRCARLFWYWLKVQFCCWSFCSIKRCCQGCLLREENEPFLETFAAL